MSESVNKESTNVLIIGKSGVGKSSLLNYMFGRDLQEVGVGAPVTKMEIKEFPYQYDDHFVIHVYDTWGLEPSEQKAEEWKEKIFREIKRHDARSISEWFNTIIFCLNAKSSRVEDFELDIMEELLREKNHLTFALTHCTSREDQDGRILKDRIKEELEKRGLEAPDEGSFVFVSNVRKKLLGGTVEQFGREEIFTSIIRNVWASLKSKVPHQARIRYENKFALKKAELLKKPDKLIVLVPFMKMKKINQLEKEINQNCDEFVKALVSEIDGMYTDALEYYSALSKKYAIIGFGADPGQFEAAADIHFDARQTLAEQVASDLRLLKERMQILNDLLRDKKVENRLRNAVIDFRILMKDTGRIKKDLKAELNRYMDTVGEYLDEHLQNIEDSLNSLEIDDLYMFQAKNK